MAVQGTKYSGLPDVDYATPDVLETPDPEQLIPLLSVTSLNNARNHRHSGTYLPRGTHSVHAEDICNSSQPSVQSRGPGNTLSDGSLGDSIVSEQFDPKVARQLFSRHVLESDGANFSGQFMSNLIPNSGYKVSRLPANFDRSGSTGDMEPLTSENALRRLEAVKMELSQISDGMASFAGEEKSLLEDLFRAADEQASKLLSQLSSSVGDLGRAERVLSELGALLSQVSTESYTFSMEDHSQSTSSSERTFKSGLGSELADFDKRLAKLECDLGLCDAVRQGSYSGLQTAQKERSFASLQPVGVQLDHLEAQMKVILELGSPDTIMSRLEDLNKTLSKSLDLKRNLDLFEKDGNRRVELKLAKDATCQLYPSDVDESLQKVNQLYELKTQVDPIVSGIPHVLARLTALKQLFFESSSIADAVQVQKEMAHENRERMVSLSKLVQDLHGSMVANLELSKSNVLATQGCVSNLLTKLQKL